MSQAQNISHRLAGQDLQAPARVEERVATSQVLHAVKGHSLALLLVAVAYAVRSWLDAALQDTLPFAFFVVPVLITAWRFGLASSLFATALGLIVGLWFFVQPRYGPAITHPAGWIATGIYLLTAAMVCWFTEKLRRAKRHAEHEASELNARQQMLMKEVEVRRRVEEALGASERRYRAVIGAIPNLVWTAGADGACDFAGPQWEHYTGLPATAFLGDGWGQLVHPTDRDGVQAAWDEAVRNVKETEFDLRLRGRDGSYRWFKTRAVPLLDDTGKGFKWFAACTDINSLKETQEILTRSQQELEQRILERTAEVERLKNQPAEENSFLREKVAVNESHPRIVGRSDAVHRVLAQAEQVAGTDATVLLLGETGTGKELLAESIHKMSARKGKPMVSVNCAAIPGALVESELFGREKGAFTGSLSRQIGRFEMADRSTIFLDEIGELSLEIQAKLLRVLEAREVERLGNPKPITVDVRVMAATNRNLESAMAEGKFRQDLYYRLNVFPITLPPLRNRAEDIPLLVWEFVAEFAERFSKNIESIERGSMEALQHYAWPGNIRELRNLIERAMIVASGPKLRIHLPAVATPAATPHARKLEEVEREHMLSVLEESGWRVRGPSGAAEKLGLKPTTLEGRMARLGIRRPG